MKQQKYLTLMLFLIIYGCASTPQTTRLPQAEPPPLEDGWGRVYVTAGKSGIVQLWSKHQVGPFLINEREVGSTAKGEYIMVDLRPGTYVATCTQHEPFNTTNLPIELQINEGEQRYFACDMAFEDEFDSLAEELILPGGWRGFLSIASGEISFLMERPIDLYDSKLSSHTKFTGASDSQQSISPGQEIQKDFSSTFEGEVPSSGDTVTANVVTADEVSSDFDVSGTYISEITSTSSKTLPRWFRNLEITLDQSSNKITGSDKSGKVGLHGILEGNTIDFYMLPNEIIGFNDSAGNWKFSIDGKSARGTWKVKGGRKTSGNWNLTKIK
jgi:hypothetical protein